MQKFRHNIALYKRQITSHYSCSARSVLDQRKQNRRGSVEKYEHTTSKLAMSPQFINKSGYTLVGEKSL